MNLEERKSTEHRAMTQKKCKLVIKNYKIYKYGNMYTYEQF